MPLLGTIILIYRITSAVSSASIVDKARGLFQLRARGACVIRFAAARLDTPDHPLLGTIFLLRNELSRLRWFGESKHPTNHPNGLALPGCTTDARVEQRPCR